MKTFLMTTILPVLMVDPPTEVTEPATKLFQIIKYLCLVAGGIVILL